MWKYTHNAAIAVGPSAVMFYSGAIALASGASDNPAARSFRDDQIDLIAVVLSTPSAMVGVTGVVALWAVLVWVTAYMENRAETKKQALLALGTRAQDCADGIARLMALHQTREALANHHAWRHKEDRDYFVAAASNLSDYNVLYGQEALAILKNAERKGVTLQERAIQNAEIPTNAHGIKRVGDDLAILADRLKTNDTK
jgi:hypothetical protein